MRIVKQKNEQEIGIRVCQSPKQNTLPVFTGRVFCLIPCRMALALIRPTRGLTRLAQWHPVAFQADDYGGVISLPVDGDYIGAHLRRQVDSAGGTFDHHRN